MSPVAPKAICRMCVDHAQLWAIALCKLPSQTKVVIMPTNNRPVFIENIFRFSCRGLSYREKYWSVTKCHLKTLVSWDNQSYPGSTWASAEDVNIKTKTLFRITIFSVGFSQGPGSGWSWSGKLGTVSAWSKVVYLVLDIIKNTPINAPDWIMIIAATPACRHRGTRIRTTSTSLI